MRSIWMSVFVGVFVCGGWAVGQVPTAANPGWVPVVDEVYLQEVSERIETAKPLTAVAVLGDSVYVGADDGLFLVDGDGLSRVSGPQGSVQVLATVGSDLWAGTSKGLWRYDGSDWEKIGDEAVVSVAAHLDGVLVATAGSVYTVDDDGISPVISSDAPIIAAASYSDSVYVLTTDGVSFVDQHGELNIDDVKDWGTLPQGATIRGMTSLGNRLALPTDEGVTILRGSTFSTITGGDGLCYEDTTCVARGFEKLDYWVGTMKGAIRVVDGEFQYFGYERWLPNEKVNGIAAGDKAVYIATDGGLGIIRYVPWTLQKKAAHYKQYMTDMGMRRLGFIHLLHTDGKGNYTRFLGDNDVSFTCHFLDGLCFEYAVTKDPKVREDAIDVFKAIKWSEEITPIDGYAARGIHAVGEEANLTNMGSAGRAAEWNPTEDGKWVWKGDTSSDEVVAHFFSVPLFHDLVAETEVEKAAAIEHLQRMLDHIIDNGWCVRDLDGNPTVWAQWSPEFIYSPEHTDERGLNSLEALSFVAVANALFPAPKYAEAKQQLLDWGYLDNVLRQKITFPHYTRFDDRLAFLSFYPLLRYETDPTIRSAVMRSLQRSWEVKRIEHQTWFNFIYGAMSGNACEVAQAVDHLKLYPLTCVNYSYENSHRDDLHNPNPTVYRNYLEQWHPFTPRELGWQRWNRSFQQPDGGGGYGISDPSGWLDAYWMGRYYGMIEAPTTTDPDMLTVKPDPNAKGAKPYDGPPRPDIF